MQILADWLNIEPHVLRFGETTITSVRDKRKRWDEGIGYQEREVFEAFLALPAPQRKMMREMILLVAKACEAEPKS